MHCNTVYVFKLSGIIVWTKMALFLNLSKYYLQVHNFKSMAFFTSYYCMFVCHGLPKLSGTELVYLKVNIGPWILLASQFSVFLSTEVFRLVSYRLISFTGFSYLSFLIFSFTVSSCTLWLGHLAKSTLDKDIYEFLERYGDIANVFVSNNQHMIQGGLCSCTAEYSSSMVWPESTVLACWQNPILSRKAGSTR